MHRGRFIHRHAANWVFGHRSVFHFLHRNRGVNHADDRFLDFFRLWGQSGDAEEAEGLGRQRRGNLDLAAFFIHGDAAGQGRRDARVLLQNLLLPPLFSVQ
jgi:hypothetical protein